MKNKNRWIYMANTVKAILNIQGGCFGRIGLLLSLLLGIQISWAQINVSLGPDIVNCGPYLLDAGFPGASYQWSTGDTTQTVMISQSDTITVMVEQGGQIGRDTIEVYIVPVPLLPTLPDTMVCSDLPFSIGAGISAQSIYWYDSTNLQVISQDSALTLMPTASSTYFVEGVNTLLVPLPTDSLSFNTVGNSSSGNYFPVSNDRGLVFDAIDDFYLVSVDIYVQQVPYTGHISLEDVNGQVLDSVTVTLQQVGQNRVNLDFFIPSGNDHQLMLRNPPALPIFVDFPINFPLNEGLVNFKRGVPINNHYNFFYNWQVGYASCSSGRDSFFLDVVPSPQVNLGADTLVCGAQLILDASFPGASYLWSDGSTGSTLQVNQSGTVSVRVSQGSCEVWDSIVVDIVPAIDPPIVMDTTVCGPQEVVLSGQTSADQIAWYFSATGDSLAFIGSPVIYSIDSTTQLFAEAQEISTITTTTAGYAAPLGGGQSGYYPVTNTRGISFDATKGFFLNGVSIYINNLPVTANLVIRNSTGAVLFSAPLTLDDIGENQVPIGIFISPGQGYEILLENPTGGNLYVDFPVSYPFEDGPIKFLAGTPFATHYNFFYKWRIGTGYCASSRVPATITVADNPTVKFGPDTAICGASYTLDVSNLGASYQWSTGSVDPFVTLTGSDTISVAVSIGNCVERDTVAITFLEEPLTPTAIGATICGVGEGGFAVEKTDSANIVWFPDQTSRQALAVGDTAWRLLMRTDTLYAEAQTSVPVSASTDTAGLILPGNSASGDYFATTSNRGNRFDARVPFMLHAVTIYASNPPVSGDVRLIDSSGLVIYSKSVTLDMAGANRVILDFSVPKSNDLILRFDNRNGGNLYVDFPVQYPIDAGYLVFTEGVPLADHYNYFYNWEIGLGRCVSPRIPVVVDVKLPLELGDSIYSCVDTLLDASISGTQFLWSTGDATPTTLATQTGWYRVVVFDSEGCTVEDSVFVEIPTDAGLPRDGILCGQVLTTNYGPDAIQVWSTGDSTTTLDISSLGMGTYSVIVQEPRGCTLTDTITVTGFDEFPELELGPDVRGCDSVLLSVSVDSVTYLWSTGDTLPDIAVFSSGLYSLTVTNENDCASRDTVGVLITSKPQADFFIPDTVFSPGLTVSFVNQSPFAGYLWHFGDGASSTQVNPVHVYPDTGSYCVRLIATDQQNNCGSDTIERCFVLLRMSTNLAVSDASDGPKLFPNPADDLLKVQLPIVQGPNNEWSGSLVDGTGRTLRRYHWPGGSVQTISLEELGVASGLYWWVFSDGNRSLSVPLRIN